MALKSQTHIYVMNFKQFLETWLYHGTSKAAADSIQKNGIDVSNYRSGLYKGFYLAPRLSYFLHSKQPEAILAFNIDPSKLLDADKVTDDELEAFDATFDHRSRHHPYYRYGVTTRMAQANGYMGITHRGGAEVIIFDNRIVKAIREVPVGGIEPPTFSI